MVEPELWCKPTIPSLCRDLVDLSVTGVVGPAGAQAEPTLDLLVPLAWEGEESTAVLGMVPGDDDAGDEWCDGRDKWAGSNFDRALPFLDTLPGGVLCTSWECDAVGTAGIAESVGAVAVESSDASVGGASAPAPASATASVLVVDVAGAGADAGAGGEIGFPYRE